MKYVTDQQAAAIPALAGLEETERAEVLADADQLYGAIDENAWIEDPDLRAWAAQRDLGPDRTNRALQLLADTSRIVTIGTPPAPSAEPVVAKPLPAEVGP